MISVVNIIVMEFPFGGIDKRSILFALACIVTCLWVLGLCVHFPNARVSRSSYVSFVIVLLPVVGCTKIWDLLWRFQCCLVSRLLACPCKLSLSCFFLCSSCVAISTFALPPVWLCSWVCLRIYVLRRVAILPLPNAFIPPQKKLNIPFPIWHMGVLRSFFLIYHLYLIGVWLSKDQKTKPERHVFEIDWAKSSNCSIYSTFNSKRKWENLWVWLRNQTDVHFR